MPKFKAHVFRTDERYALVEVEAANAGEAMAMVDAAVEGGNVEFTHQGGGEWQVDLEKEE